MPVKEISSGVYKVDGKLATRNLVKGKRVYNEDLIISDGAEYRLWNPYRSKLSAAILNGLKNMYIKNESHVIYLGAATGTTVSHVSDIVTNTGRVYAIELSERNVRNLLGVAESRKNILPILADANDIENYKDVIEQCDCLYQDISARNQAHILLANSYFLKKGGYAYFAIKSQSIDISKKPKEVYKQELDILKGHFELIESISLEPYDSMHLFAVLKKI